MAARLQHKLHEIAVPRGTFLIGRGADCQLTLDDALVSRRHAVIRVGEGGAAQLEDLGSRNGVYLNGVRLEKPEPLRDGDMIRIGSQDICFTLPRTGDTPVTGMRAARVTIQEIPADQLAAALAKLDTLEREPGSSPAPSTSPVPRVPPSPPSSPTVVPVPPPSRPIASGLPPTMFLPAVRDLRPVEPESADEMTSVANLGPSRQPTSGLAIIGSVAEKALALGRAEEAERILSRALADTLARAARGEVDAELAERAGSFALRLAAGTARGAWIDYFFQLYTALRALPPARLVDELYTAVRKVKATDKAVLRAYTACLKQIAGSFGPAERFVQQRIEGFERWAP